MKKQDKNPIFVSELIQKYGTLPKRLSQKEERARIEGGKNLVEATIVAERSLVSREIDSRKGSTQEEVIEEYAKKSGLWINDYKTHFGELANQGIESDVYLNPDNITLTKINNGIQYISPLDFLDSIAVWNFLFPATKYTLTGFTKKEGKLAYILEQSLIIKDRSASYDELLNDLKNLSFNIDQFTRYRGAYHPELDIWLRDLHDENVVSKDGKTRFIDAIIDLNTPEKGNGGKKIIPITKYITTE